MGTAAVLAFGLLILLVGIVFGIDGAQEGEEAAWHSFLFGGIAALVTGVASYLLGRREEDAGARRAGRIALSYVTVAMVVFVIAAAT